jgi:Ca-activated chloride channel family protein
MRSRNSVGSGSIAEASKDAYSMPSEAKVNGRVDLGTLSDKKENSPSSTSQIPNSQVPNSQIQVLSITGLTGVDVGTAQQAIEQQLRTVVVPAGFNGIVILEIPLQNGRLIRFLLDDVASTLKDKNLVELLKRSLQNVVLPAAARGTIRLTLNVTSNK